MVQAQVLNLMGGLVKELGLGLMLISHDLSVLGTHVRPGDRDVRRAVVEEGPADELFDRPHHPYSGALAAAFPRVGDPAGPVRPVGPGR